jgi:hypothetical protein
VLTPFTLSLDLAHAVIDERLEYAAQDALADQVRHAASASRSSSPFWSFLASLAPRHWLAGGLRWVAARLDPTVCHDAPLIVLKAR